MEGILMENEVQTMRKLRVMIVDDQKRTRDSLAALLRTWEQTGEIREAANGLEAIGLAQVFQPDMILMDVRMLKMDGIQAARVIKQQMPQTKVIVLSVYSDLDGEAMQANADAFISKSESPERLLGIVQMLSIMIDPDEQL